MPNNQNQRDNQGQFAGNKSPQQQGQSGVSQDPSKKQSNNDRR